MRCEEFEERLGELESVDLPAPLREHAAGCAVCRGYLRDWRVARAGLRLLAAEPVPEVSVGFAARIVRQLEETAPVRASEEFLEHVGRRFVYASLALALTVLRVAVLDPSAPLHVAPGGASHCARHETFAEENDDEP